jgi:hypothetical protein
MSRSSHLAITLWLAACGHTHVDAQDPIFAPPAAAPLHAPVTPNAQSAPLVEVPVEAPAAETPAATVPATVEKPLFKKKNCNPMSRAGCRWQKEDDEREKPRVKTRDAN